MRILDIGARHPLNSLIEVLPKQAELFIALSRLHKGFAEEHLAHLYGVSQPIIENRPCFEAVSRF